MVDQKRRFEDIRTPGSLDPGVALGMLITQVENLQETTESTAKIVGKMSDDIMDIKLSRAVEAGQRKGFLSSARLMEILITVGTGVVTAWGTVKALGTSQVPHP